MKQPDDIPRWYFVDESGDTAFYARRSKRIIIGENGCSKTLILGFLRTRDPQDIRAKLAEVRLAISESKYLQNIVSVKNSVVCFHAKNDCPEVRQLVFEAMEKMSFSAQVIVGRKIERVYRKQHRSNPDRFYDELVTKLFFGQLHRSMENHITFAQRGNKTRQHSLRAAVNRSVERFLENKNKNWEGSQTINVTTSRPVQESVLQAIDYILWAVHRAYEHDQMRYFEFLRPRVELLRDIYDLEKKRGAKESCCYDRDKNCFDIKKASPLS